MSILPLADGWDVDEISNTSNCVSAVLSAQPLALAVAFLS